MYAFGLVGKKEADAIPLNPSCCVAAGIDGGFIQNLRYPPGNLRAYFFPLFMAIYKVAERYAASGFSGNRELESAFRRLRNLGAM